MHGRWRLGCVVGCEPWLDSPGEGRGDPSPSGPPSWKTSVGLLSGLHRQPGSSSFPSQDSSF